MKEFYVAMGDPLEQVGELMTFKDAQQEVDRLTEKGETAFVAYKMS